MGPWPHPGLPYPIRSLHKAESKLRHPNQSFSSACPEFFFVGNLLIVCSDPGDDLDPRFMHRLEPFSLLLGISHGSDGDRDDATLCRLMLLWLVVRLYRIIVDHDWPFIVGTV